MRMLNRTLLTAALSLVFAASSWAEPHFKVLHAFGSGEGGAGLWGSVVLDGAGNLYGTTSGGGVYGYGTVFELTPHANGEWTHSVLHSFENDGPDGADPNSGPIFDSVGNLYGTTTFGGANHYGAVFEMVRGSGEWDESVIYSFPLPGGECCPYAGLAIGGAGELYGTAGAVFQLKSGSSGWQAEVLHKFCSWPNCRDGDGPFAGVILDGAGDLYGTTEAGGENKSGVVYEVRHTSSGWKEQVLHAFPTFRQDGHSPNVGALAFDTSGNLYGTTIQGGANICSDVGCGTIFRLTRGAGGHWNETILYNFNFDNSGVNGFGPGAGVVIDKSGNLYGTAIYGGTCCGVVYELSPGSNDTWTYKVLHTFSGGDGAQPDANLILDDSGNLYGTTATGGAGGGVVFEVTP